MASAGMLHRGRNSGPESGDEVQRSLELLDSVLSEFEEAGGGAGGTAPTAASNTAQPTPDDDSPSLGGHQSEDDGYMSMNGRRTKFALSFHPTEEKGEPVTAVETITMGAEPEAGADSPGGGLDSPGGGTATPGGSPETDVAKKTEINDKPPPPAEAERIISTLLPKVSPSNTSSRLASPEQPLSPPPASPVRSLPLLNGNSKASNSTQTTLPKTRHQRPFGWEKGSPCKGAPPAPAPGHTPCRFSSLQHGPHHAPPPPSPVDPPAWLPPRHVPPKISKTIFPLTNSFNYENDFVLGNMPYNEHPVTIYPGANVPYTKQLSSPTYGLPKTAPLSTSLIIRSPTSQNGKKQKDAELLSPGGKVPPRTLAGSMERHREVCRGPGDLTNNMLCVKTPSSDTGDEHFSDDSLEESLPPPPPVLTPSKRSSIAWEVSLDDDDPLLTPGSTKVVGRRRRKSGDNSHSSTGSIPQRVEEWISEAQGEFWPPPPVTCSTEDEIASPFSDTESEHLPLPEDITEINATGTYIIRRGKKDRKNIPEFNNKKPIKPPRNLQHLQNDNPNNKQLDGEQSMDGSSLSISGLSLSGSQHSVSSLNSRLSSDLSIPHSRYSVDFNSRFSRELTTPNSRYSVDLCLPPGSRIGKELTSPKSRLSLDLNNGQEKCLNRDLFIESPKSKNLSERCEYVNKNTAIPNKLSPQNRFTDFKKYSCTFDNIQSLMKEGSEQPICYNETPAELPVVRVVSLPSLSDTEVSGAARQLLTTTVEEEEDFESPSHSSEDTSPLKKIENNISALLNQGRDHQFSPQYMHKDWDIHKDDYHSNVDPIIDKRSFNSGDRHKRNDIQKSSSHNEIPNKRLLDYHREKTGSSKRNGIHKSMSSKDMPIAFNRQTSSDSTSSSGADFPIHVQIVEHGFGSHKHEFGPLPVSPASPQFPPLPPSPVQEDDEYSEILHPLEKTHISKKADTLPTPSTDIYHRSCDPPMVPPHRECATNSLKTRSMDTGFSKNRRSNNSNKSMSADRRTLPSDMGMMSGRRRTFQRSRRNDDSTSGSVGVGTGTGGLQSSASLPETPVFGRGCDVPRTPHRRSHDGPRQSNTMNSLQSSTMNSIQTMTGSMGGYGRGGVGGSMERALAGAEVLRLAGGPARGWYPKQRHRPASIEHLERLPLSAGVSGVVGGPTGGWGERDNSRKPLTLPPNLTPKFFHKSPREALRRVTSLLIRKGGGSSKESGGSSSKKDRLAVSPAARSANGEETVQKQRKGFFKSLWKRSRHYSLEQP